MQSINDYFTGLGTDDIRIAGHRIGIDDVLIRHLYGTRAEDIQNQLDTLSLEEIYACLLYYYAHQSEMDAYLERLSTWRAQRVAQDAALPSPLKRKLLEARQSREAR